MTAPAPAPSRLPQSKKGLTLVEVMMALFVFAVLSIGITGMVLRGRMIAQNNIMRNTAHSVAQGYLEQIKSLPLQSINGALAGVDAGLPAQSDLPTKSISASESSSIEKMDPLFLLGPVESPHARYPDVAISVDEEGWNHKQVMLDLQDDQEGNPQEVLMDMWIKVTVESLGYQTKAHRIIVDFEYETRRMGGIRHKGSLRNIRAQLNSTGS